MKFRPRLRSILLALNLLVLLLPLGGIAILRLYENELVRQTESELISQAAFAASAFREAYLQEQHGSDAGAPLPGKTLPVVNPEPDDDRLMPLPPQLDVARTTIQPPAPPAAVADAAPDPVAAAAGKALNPVIAGARKIVLSGIRIVDHQGIVVASSRGEEGMSLAGRGEVAHALKGEPVSVLRDRYSHSPVPALESLSRGARIRIFVALPVIVHDRVIGAVITSRTPLDVTKALYQIRIPLLKAGLVLILIALLMTLLVTYAISRPMKALLAQVDRVKAGGDDSLAPVANPVVHEVAELSNAISHLAVTVAARSEYIRTFAANVSHEFKTPLTSLRGGIELLREQYDDMSRSDRERFLAILGEETDRLDTMVKRLMDLARAEVYHPGGEVTTLGPALEEAARRYRNRGGTVTISPVPGDERARMAPEIFSSVISNLLENSLVHNGPGTAVTMELLPRNPHSPNLLRLRVADNGTGISAANAERVFRPFFTTAREKGGTGLGLAITRSLLEAHGGGIHLCPSDKGAVFEVLLPG